MDNKEYRKIDCGAGNTVEDAVKILKGMHMQGCKVYIDFNGHKLYSDTVTMDDAYMTITGKTKAEIEQDQLDWKEAYDKELKEHIEKIPEEEIQYRELAVGVLRDDKLEYWNKIIQVRLNDLYRGMELGCTLEIGDYLNNKDFEGAKIALNNQGHSGMSYGLVKAMVKEFCNNSEEFLDIID